MPSTNGHGPKRAALLARVSTEDQAADDKTSISEQLLASRRYADAHGYTIVEEIKEDISGRKRNTPGLERIRDLAEDGAIDAVLVYKWNRLARTVRRYENFVLEMKLAGVDVVSLDGQSNDTASGRMFNRLMAVFSEYQRDDLVETMQQGKRGQARAGKIVPGRFAPYGFIYHRESRSYCIDEDRMIHARRLFRMVGVEGHALWAVKKNFDRDLVPTTKGGRYWHVTTLRDMILNDCYRPHTQKELKALVEAGNLSAEVLAGLDLGKAYGIRWYNRHRVETDEDDKQHKTPKAREEWIAAPVPDAGIPSEWVDAARQRIKDNVRPSDAGRRYWNLKGLLYCPCGSRLAPFTTRKKSVVHFYYVCRRHRSGKDPCPHAKYHRAEDLEERVRRFVVDLIRNPGTLREQVKAKAERQKQALRRPEKAIRAWARQAADADAERDRYNRLYARGKLSDDEYDAYMSELDRRKAAAEEELHRFEDARRELEVLEALPELVKEYLDWLPHHLEMPIYKTGDRQPDEPLKPYRVAPDTVKPRSPIDRDAMRQRERGVYDDLRLKVMAPRDGDPVAEWSGGRKLLDIPTVTRRRTSGTTRSCSRA